MSPKILLEFLLLILDNGRIQRNKWLQMAQTTVKMAQITVKLAQTTLKMAQTTVKILHNYKI